MRARYSLTIFHLLIILIETCTIDVTRIGTVMVTDSDTATFKFNDGHDQDNIWGSGSNNIEIIVSCIVFVIACFHTAGVPYDGVPNNRLVTIELPLAVFYTILGALGIIFAVSCLCFNFIFRKKPLVYI